jgi:hypothetical protein
MPVPKEELEGSPTLSWTRNSGTAVQKFRILWEHQEQFLLEVFPIPYVSLNRLIIPKAASYPGKFWLIADSVDIEPFQPDSPSGFNEVPNYYPAGAKVTVHYKTPEYDQDGNGNDGPGTPIAFVKHKVTIGGEYLTYPSQALSWYNPVDDSLAPELHATPKDYAVSEDMHCAVTIPLIEHQMTWPQVAFPPWLGIRQCVGKVNAYPFAGAPPETLLFLGADAEREITNTGLRTWTLTYKFAEKNQNAQNPASPQGWNFFLRTDGQQAGTFQRLRKRVPGGATRMKDSLDGITTTFRVQSAQGFPRGTGFKVKISGGRYNVLTTGGGNDWELGLDDDGGVVTIGPMAKGTAISQIFASQLAQAMTVNTSVLRVKNRTAFPKTGQFLVQVDAEIMAVISGHGLGVGNFVVLRGVQATSIAAHAINSTVDLVSGNIYDLADFRVLFLSGMIIG